jgi:two-component system response regulator AtoC
MNSVERLLIIDDEPALRHLLRTILEEEGYQVDEAENGQRGLERVSTKTFDLILCDIRMPELDGMGFIKKALANNPALTIIMMSAYGSLETALQCMQHGAYDYISKPFRPDEVVLTIKKALERLKLQNENKQLRHQLHRSRPTPKTIGNSQVMREILEKVDTLAQVKSPVLICGETGTGKELIARALHENSQRSNKPFIAINCSAISAHLIESELFGHRKGSFTGADKSHTGLFAAAHGGTLFLDEIGELPLDVQPKLLRVLQEGEVRPVGETKPNKIDVRIVTATACTLKDEVQSGSFREDLYYRLAVVELNLPALRSRPDDIPALANHFVQLIAQREQRSIPQLTHEALNTLQSYRWPGNIRELENMMEKIMIFHHGEQIELEHLPPELTTPQHNQRRSMDALSLKVSITALEKHHISAALVQTSGNRVQAAKILEISLRSLHYKIKEYGI